MNRRQVMEAKLPRGRPVRARKRRAWDPENPTPAPGSSLASTAVEEASLDQQDTPSSGTPSQALVPESGGNASTSRAKRKPAMSSKQRKKFKNPCKDQADVHNKAGVNYGSEPGSSDEDDEGLAPILRSRACECFMETPADTEEGGELAGAMEGDFQWRDFCDHPIPASERREPFTAVAGPVEPCDDPYHVFVSIFDEEIMKEIVKQTNKYAQDLAAAKLAAGVLGPKSRICGWVDTNIDEMYTYFAIIMAMGMVLKSKIEEYWSKENNIFVTPGFRAYMSLYRFQILNTCLHFNDNSRLTGNESPGEAKLFKIEPLIRHLNEKFQALYVPSQNIALDESLMQWKGWLSINQFISNKAAKVGVKSYELCESQTGYLWRFIVHAKKHGALELQTPMDAATPRIVLELLEGLENKGYTIWMDNFYHSPALARQLKGKGFDAVGTLRTNRQFVPKQLSELTKDNMRKGEIVGYTAGDVDVMVWRDENRVGMISTYHGNSTTMIAGKIKPCLIIDYNVMMGGVDKKDQLLSLYPIERKRTRVWYKKIFRKLLNVSILNSYIIAKKSGYNWEHREFRKDLVVSILSRHSSQSVPTPVAVEPTGFNIKTHHVVPYPFMVGGKGRLRRKCVVCKAITSYYCAGCEKTTCIFPCFVTLHS